MILDINMKLEVSPEWFEEQAKRKDGWEERLCEILSVYRVKDEAGAKEAVDKLRQAEVSEELIKRAME